MDTSPHQTQEFRRRRSTRRFRRRRNRIDEQVTRLIHPAMHTQEEDEQVPIAQEEESHQEEDPLGSNPGNGSSNPPPPPPPGFYPSTAIRRIKSSRRHSTNYASNSTSSESSNRPVGTTRQVQKTVAKAVATFELQKLQHSRYAADARSMVRQVYICHRHLARACSTILDYSSSSLSQSQT